MNLTDVYKIPLKKKKKKRIGRGEGSGKGKTCGRGHKGARSRSGYGGRIWYEGGQMPLFRRLPKRGFNNPWKQEFLIINVGELNSAFEDGDEVSLEILTEKNIVKNKKSKILPLKVLGDGDLEKKLTVKAHKFSKSAREKIEKAGGEAEKLEIPTDRKRRKQKESKEKARQKKSSE